MQTGAHAEVQTHEAAPETAAASPAPAKEFASALGNAALARRITAINSAAVARNGEQKEEDKDTPETRAKKALSKAMPPQFGTFLNVAWGDMLPGQNKSVREGTKLFGLSFDKDFPAPPIPIFPPLVWLRFGANVSAFARADGGYTLGWKRDPAPMDKPWAVEDKVQASGNVAFKAKANGSLWTELTGGIPGLASVGARLSAGVEADAAGSVQVNGDVTRGALDPEKQQVNPFSGNLAYTVDFRGDIWGVSKAGVNATLVTPIKDKKEKAEVTLGSWKLGFLDVKGTGFLNLNTGQVHNNVKVTGELGGTPEHSKRRYKLDDRNLHHQGPRVASNDEPGLEEPTLVADAGGGPSEGGAAGDDSGDPGPGPTPAVVA